MDTIAVQRDNLDGDTLLLGIMTRKLEDRRIFSHIYRLDSLITVEPGDVRDEAFDDEHPVRVKYPGHIPEAVGLTCLVEQAKQRIGYQIHQPERADNSDLRHVANRDGYRVTARLGPHPANHRFRSVNALDPHSAASQWKRDPAGPNPQLQNPSVPGQPGEKVSRRPRVAVAVMLVVNARPAIAIERRILEFSHAVTKADCRSQRLHIFWRALRGFSAPQHPDRNENFEAPERAKMAATGGEARRFAARLD